MADHELYTVRNMKKSKGFSIFPTNTIIGTMNKTRLFVRNAKAQSPDNLSPYSYEI